MGLWDWLFKKTSKEKEVEELEDSFAEHCLDLLWDRYEKEQVVSPYAELMAYEAEINNGGHSQFFLNTENCGDVNKTIEALLTVLPKKLNQNLARAYKAYLALNGAEEDDRTEALYEACDDFFYENEGLLIDVLKEYAVRTVV